MKLGKTTLLKFISGIFYGISKNKNGKEISDYERYKPWNSEEFSGKIKYELDNLEQFEVYRDFNKKNPQIYDENAVDISKKFNIDKTKGNEFFYEQTKIDETLFFSTTLMEQKEVVLNDKSKHLLTQKISNILSTGEDNISYKKTIDKINKRIIEEVGTDRTVGRPINILEKDIDENKKARENILDCEDKKQILEENIKNIKEKISIKEKIINLLKIIKEKKEEENLEKEKITLSENIKNEYEEKINKLENKIVNVGSNDKNQKTNVTKYFALILILFFLVVICFFNINKIIKYSIILLSILVEVFIVINLIKYNKKKSEKNESQNKIKNEIEILKENVNKIEKEINEKNNALNEKKEKDRILIENEFYNYISREKIEELIKCDLKEIEYQKTIEEDNLNSEKFKLQTENSEHKQVLCRIEEKIMCDEKFENLMNQKNELLKKEKVLNLAKVSLENAYEKLKKEVTPKFTKNLGKTMEEISNKKYKNVCFNDEEGLTVELENGEYINGNRLSVGTIDQLYLALRIAVISEISKEKMPIILDEAFAYYDDERLTNVLRFFANDLIKNQIIIFSCTEREQKILDNLGIEYNLVEI